MDNEFDPGLLFLVNKSGFPIGKATWERMFRFSKKLSDDSEQEKIGVLFLQQLASNDILLSEIKTNMFPFPSIPLHFNITTPIEVRVGMVQDYMKQLQYNHTGTQFFDIKKYRPLSGLMETAKEIIRESLPIKCLEAVILGIYMTNGFTGLERFTIGFRSEFNGCVHRHVVLGLYHAGCYGALGMSRRSDLMYKPLEFKCLADMIMDYKISYEKFWHKLTRVKIGHAISHDCHSFEGIPWKGAVIHLSKLSEREIKSSIEKFSRQRRSKSFMSMSTSMPNLAKSDSTFTLNRRESSILRPKKEKTILPTKSEYEMRI